MSRSKRSRRSHTSAEDSIYEAEHSPEVQDLLKVQHDIHEILKESDERTLYTVSNPTKPSPISHLEGDEYESLFTEITPVLVDDDDLFEMAGLSHDDLVALRDLGDKGAGLVCTPSPRDQLSGKTAFEFTYHHDVSDISTQISVSSSHLDSFEQEVSNSGGNAQDPSSQLIAASEGSSVSSSRNITPRPRRSSRHHEPSGEDDVAGGDNNHATDPVPAARSIPATPDAHLMSTPRPSDPHSSNSSSSSSRPRTRSVSRREKQEQEGYGEALDGLRDEASSHLTSSGLGSTSTPHILDDLDNYAFTPVAKVQVRDVPESTGRPNVPESTGRPTAPSERASPARQRRGRHDGKRSPLRANTHHMGGLNGNHGPHHVAAPSAALSGTTTATTGVLTRRHHQALKQGLVSSEFGMPHVVTGRIGQAHTDFTQPKQQARMKTMALPSAHLQPTSLVAAVSSSSSSSGTHTMANLSSPTHTPSKLSTMSRTIPILSNAQSGHSSHIASEGGSTAASVLDTTTTKLTPSLLSPQIEADDIYGDISDDLAADSPAYISASGKITARPIGSTTTATTAPPVGSTSAGRRPSTRSSARFTE